LEIARGEWLNGILIYALEGHTIEGQSTKKLKAKNPPLYCRNSRKKKEK
jgi:hypothetical protein